MAEYKFSFKLDFDGKALDAGLNASRSGVLSFRQAAVSSGESIATSFRQVQTTGLAIGTTFNQLTGQLTQNTTAVAANTQAAKQQAAAQLEAARAAAAAAAAAAAGAKTTGAGLDDLDKRTVAVGMSARATAAALRQVPMQVTDIVVGLASGQAPMTVLLQQGGQLKDVFGGVGPAVRALGGYVMGLINPITVVGALALGIALAFSAGQKEGEAYSRAIILSGNAAGTTSDKLQQYARNISAVAGTQGAAAEALATFAQAGTVADANLQQAADAALRFEKATGQAVGETAKQFSELAKSPLEASVKLNQQYNFLTASVYEQIKALQEQGKTTEAANLAQTTFADTLKNRSGEILQNIGFIEKRWLAVKAAIGGVVDATLNLGREATAGDKISEINAKLLVLKTNLQDYLGKGFGDDDRLVAGARKQIAALEQLRGSTIAGTRAKEESAKATAKDAAAIQLKAEFDKDGEKFLSNKIKLQKELVSETTRGEELIAAKLLTRSQLEGRLADIKKKYRDTEGESALENALSAELALYKGYADDRTAILAGAEKSAESLRKQGLLDERQLADALFRVRDDALVDQIAIAELSAATAGGKKQKAEQQRFIGEVAKLNTQRENNQRAHTDRLAEIDAEQTKRVRDKVTEWELEGEAAKRTLAVEYALYGQTAEARAVALVGLKLETEAEKLIADAKRAGIPFSEAQAASIRAEAAARGQNASAIAGEQQALAGAEQLRDANRRFAAESILDEDARARALLEIDADVWRRRIALAGEGTEAQKRLIAEFTTYYQNQLDKPITDRWKATVERFDTTFRQGFTRLLEGGKDKWSAFNKSILNAFKTEVADQIYKTFLKPFVVRVIGSFLGIEGGAANAATGGSSAAGLAQNASTLNTVYNIGAQYLTGSAVGASGASLAYANAVGATGGDALGALIQANGGYAGVSVNGVAGGAGLAGSLSNQAGSAFANLTGTGIDGLLATNGAYGTAAGTTSGIGAGASALGGALVGAIAGRIISGGYSAIGKNPSTAVAVGTAVGAAIAGYFTLGIGTGVGAAIGGAIGGLVNRVFGRKLTEMGIKGTFDASGFNGVNYTYEKGGLFRSDREREQGPVDNETVNLLNQAFSAVKGTVAGLAQQLGVGREAIDAFTTDVRLNFKGLDEAGISKLLDDTLSGIGNQLADAVLAQTAGLKELAIRGETSVQTLGRLATLLGDVNDVMGILNLSLFDSSVAGVKAAQSLVDAFGGTQQFAQSASVYYDKFFSEVEKQSIAVRNLAENFQSLNSQGVFSETAAQFEQFIVEPTSEGFKRLAGAQDLTTVSGQRAFAAILGLADSFSQLEQAGIQLANQRAGLEIQILRLQGKELQAVGLERQRELAAMDESLRGLQMTIYALEDLNEAGRAFGLINTNSGLRAATEAEANAIADRRDVIAGRRAIEEATALKAQDAATAATEAATAAASARTEAEQALRQAYEAEIQALDAIIAARDTAVQALEQAHQRESDLLRQAADGFGELAQSLRAFVSDLNGIADTPEQSTARLRARFNATIAAALGGDADAARNIPGAGRDYVDAASLTAATRVDMLREIARVQIATEGVIDFAEAQKTIAEQQLEALNQQVSGLLTVDQSVLSVAEAIAALQQANVAAVQAETQKAILTAQVSSLITLNESVLSVRDAILGIEQAVADVAVFAGGFGGGEGGGYGGGGGVTAAGAFGADNIVAQAENFLVAKDSRGNLIFANVDNAGILQTSTGIDNEAVARLLVQSGQDRETLNQSLLGLASQLDASGASYLPGSVFGGSDYGVDFRDLANGGFGGNNFTLDPNAALKGPTGFGTLQANQQIAAAFGIANANRELIDSYRDLNYLQEGLGLGPGGTSPVTVDELAKYRIPGFAGGGVHEGGLRWVGENGPELEYTPPSRIFSNSQSNALLSLPFLTGANPTGPRTSQATSSEVNAMRAELAEVRQLLSRLVAVSEANLPSVADHTAATAMVLRRTTRNGNALVTTTETP